MAARCDALSKSQGWLGSKMITRTQAFKIARLLLCLCVSGIQIPTFAGAPRTSTDDEAFSEHLKANAEIDLIHKTFQEEAQRLTSFSNASRSPEVATLSDSSTVKRPQLGDTRVPLHLRLIERERHAFVSGIRMIKMSLQGNCPEQVVDVTTFADPMVRSQELQRIQCQRIRRDLHQRGTHNEGLAREKSILELKLPPYTEDEMLSRQRAANRSQDAELAATFKAAEAVDGAVEQFVRFLDSHAQSMRMMNGRFMFANEADASAFNDLQNNVLKMQLNQSP
jgi:hypothetical protein